MCRASTSSIPGRHRSAYAHQGLAHGGIILRNCRVEGGRFDGIWHLDTNQGEVTADLVINAAGNQGDIVERSTAPPSSRSRRARASSWCSTSRPRDLLKAIILPVPTERTKGIVICRTAFGNVLVGPTAEDQEDRVHAEVDQTALQQLVARGVEMLPGLANVDVTAVYAGLRPATQFKDYQIAAASRIAAGSPWPASARPASPARSASRSMWLASMPPSFGPLEGMQRPSGRRCPISARRTPAPIRNRSQPRSSAIANG